MGHNGSGKSTMLKTLARILRADKGSVAVKGKVSALLELGAGFHPELSGRENVYLNGAILGLSKRDIDSRFDDIVGFAGLERFIDSPVKNYSSGMYVRLGFSVAINVDPDVLLIDEVLAVGDEEFQRKCLERVADLRAAGKTIVVVTHALSTVRNMCDQAIWLEQGEVKYTGTGHEVADEYLGTVQVEIQAQEEAQDEPKWSRLRIGDVEVLDARGQPHDEGGDRRRGHVAHALRGQRTGARPRSSASPSRRPRGCSSPAPTPRRPRCASTRSRARASSSCTCRACCCCTAPTTSPSTAPTAT